jgi:hypothetical protein
MRYTLAYFSKGTCSRLLNQAQPGRRLGEDIALPCTAEHRYAFWYYLFSNYATLVE